MRVAIVGCGRAGSQHAPAIAAAGGTVASLSDVRRERAAALALEHGTSLCSWEEVLADPAIDLVAVCTPPDRHFGLASAALAAGKAVIVEKPPTLCAADLRQLCEQAGHLKLPFAVMLQHRGRIPPPALATTWSGDASASVEIYRPRMPEHYASEAWRSDRPASGGGVFAHLALHYTDIACQVLGSCREVHTITDDGVLPGIDTRTAVCARTTTGALLTVMSSTVSKARSERLRIVDGDRELVVTSSKTRYREGTRWWEYPPLTTPALRAAVYREVRGALTGTERLERFSAAAAAGVVELLEHVLHRLTVATS